MAHLVLAVLTLAVPGAARAQDTPGDSARPEPQVRFTAEVEVVTVTAAVRDRRGRLVRNLGPADFEVLDAGVAREIRDFFAGEAPISLAVLLDISGSMAVGGNMDRARHAVAVAMGTLRAGDDEAALFTFDSRLQEVVGYTGELDRVQRVSLEGRPWGLTSLYDAIAATAKSVATRANRHRALLVITDGVDTGSQLTAPQVSGIASSIDVPVYLLVVMNPVDHSGKALAALEAGRTPGTATLADLARWTGGDMRVSSVPAHTVAAAQDLLAELRYQYLITFEPAPHPGWHPLEIRTRNRNLIVHARGGYMAGPAPSEE